MRILSYLIVLHLSVHAARAAGDGDPRRAREARDAQPEAAHVGRPRTARVRFRLLYSENSLPICACAMLCSRCSPSRVQVPHRADPASKGLITCSPLFMYMYWSK